MEQVIHPLLIGSITAYADVRDDDETPATLFVRPPAIASIKEGENAVFEIARTGKNIGTIDLSL